MVIAWEIMRTGTLVLAVHNLDLSGANQVLVNIVSESLRESNVVVLSPKLGPASQRFFDVGASIRIGDHKALLTCISDVILVVCNTIMTADLVVFLKNHRQTPSIWLLHEFWDRSQIVQQIKMRPNVHHINVDVIVQALQMASTVVFVCEAQKALYLALLEGKAMASCEVIYVGVPGVPEGDDKSEILGYSTGVTKKRGLNDGVAPREDQLAAGKAPRCSVSVPATPSSGKITVGRTDTHLHDVKESEGTATHALRSLLGISTPAAVGVETAVSKPVLFAVTSAATKPPSSQSAAAVSEPAMRTFTILVLGVVCPRKNQLWAISMFEALCARLQHQQDEAEGKKEKMEESPDGQRGGRVMTPPSAVGSDVATFVQHPMDRHGRRVTRMKRGAAMKGGAERVRGATDSDSELDSELLECNDEKCLDFSVDSVPGSGTASPTPPPGAAEGEPMKLTLLDKSEAAMDIDHQGTQVHSAVDAVSAAGGGHSVKLKLLIVGLRRTRPYEAEYADKVEKEAARVNALLAAQQGSGAGAGGGGVSDAAIEIHSITDDVNPFFERADCLLLPSTNEVTPLVIVEAMARRVPVVSTRVGGITEMLTHGVEGFTFSSDPMPPPALMVAPYVNLPDSATCAPAPPEPKSELITLKGGKSNCVAFAGAGAEAEASSATEDGLRLRSQRIYNSGDWRQYCAIVKDEVKDELEGDNEGTVMDHIPASTNSRSATATSEFLECTQYLLSLIASPALCQQLGAHGRERFLAQFNVSIMTRRYLSLIRSLSPPVVLVDLDGVVVDWDAGFLSAWRGLFAKWAGGSAAPASLESGDGLDSFACSKDIARLSTLLPTTHASGAPAPEPERHRNFEMPLCLPKEYRPLAEALFHLPGFFLSLPLKRGAVKALFEMQACNVEVMLCSAPLMSSAYCAQEKVEWIRRHLGDFWLSRLILTCEKSGMKGDILIDDKPIRALRAASAAAAASSSSIRGEHSFAATWQQVMFSMPYNQGQEETRLLRWEDWPKVILPLVGMELSEYHDVMEALAGTHAPAPAVAPGKGKGPIAVRAPKSSDIFHRPKASPAVWPRPALARTATYPPDSTPAAASEEAKGWWGQDLIPSRYDQSTMPEVVHATYLGKPITVLNPFTAPMCTSIAARSSPTSPRRWHAAIDADADAIVSTPPPSPPDADADADVSTPPPVAPDKEDGGGAQVPAAIPAVIPHDKNSDSQEGVSAERLVSAGIFSTPPRTPPSGPTSPISPRPPSPLAAQKLPSISESDASDAKEGDICDTSDRYGNRLHAVASPGPLFSCSCHGGTTICCRIAEGERKARQFLDCFKAAAPTPGQPDSGPHGVQGFGLHGNPAPAPVPVHVPVPMDGHKYVNTERVLFNGNNYDGAESAAEEGADMDASTAGGAKWVSKGCLGRPQSDDNSSLDGNSHDHSFDLCDAADSMQMEEKEQPPTGAAAEGDTQSTSGVKGELFVKSPSTASLGSTGTNWSTRTARNLDSDAYADESETESVQTPDTSA